MDSGGLEGLRVSDDKKKYIVETLNPVLEELIAECITRVPDDPAAFMIDWLRQKQGLGAVGEATTPSLAEENERLRTEVKKLMGKVEEVGRFVATHVDKTEEPERGDSEEETEDDSDAVESLPDSFRQPTTKIGARTSVSAEVYGSWNKKTFFKPPIHAKTPEQKERLRKVLESNFMFSNSQEDDLKVLIDAMEEKHFVAKLRLIKQGDQGEDLFVIETGSVEVKREKDGVETSLKVLGPGDFFGELALLYNCPRAATVDSLTPCTLWRLGRETFNHIVKEAAVQKRERYENFLSQVPLLSSFGAYERSQIADALKPEVFEDGTIIVKENDIGDKFYLMESGKAIAEQGCKGKVMDYAIGDYFGELALIRNQLRMATVKAVGKVTVLSMHRGAFKRLLGPMNEFLENRATLYRT